MRAPLNLLLCAVAMFGTALPVSASEREAAPATEVASVQCERLEAERNAADAQFMQQLKEDLRSRSDADSMASLAALEAATSAIGWARAGAGALRPEQEEQLIEAAAEGGRAAFARLWPRRDALAWSQLYPLFEHHRRELGTDERARWERYLIQRGGRSLHAFMLRIRESEESDATAEALDALLEEAAREAVPNEDIYYDAVRRMVPPMSRIPVPAVLRTLLAPCDVLDPGQESWEVSPDTSISLLAAGFAIALLPVWEFPSQQCADLEDASDSARAEACRKLARRLALEGHTLLARSIGAAHWQRLARDSAAQAEALEARRQVRWWVEEGLRWLGHEPGTVQQFQSARVEATVRLMLTPGSSELAAVRQALREAGLEDAPPQAWMPLNPDSLKP